MGMGCCSPVKLTVLSLFLPLLSSLTVDQIVLNGPGLQPDLIVMPARYFFIELRENSPSGEELLQKDVKVTVAGRSEDGRSCRIWVDTLNRKDNSFIVRYKLYETCWGLTISVEYRGKHVEGSPFVFEGPVYDEECNCPEEDIQSWLTNYGCTEIPDQLSSDLSRFPTVDFSLFYKEAIARFNNSHSSSVCHYVVKNNKVYRTCYGQHVGFKMFMDAILLSLTRKVRLPDLEFFSNLGDWPLIRSPDDKIPMFSWCGSKDTLDIVMPTYEITESSLECMGRVSMDMLSVQGKIGRRWDLKEPKGFFRGRDSSRERLKLIEISRQNPDLLNCSLTNFFFFRDEESIYGPKEKYVSFFSFFDYKYQINMDGTVAAYRFPYLLVGDSLVFKQSSIYYEHYYRDLVPWKHFIPFQKDLSDLVEVLKWARDNDEEARLIALEGQKFARKNLLPQQVFCYHGLLFNEWSKRLEAKVKVRKAMELVEQKSNNCHCPTRRPSKDEL